jgi:hypothetical protein
MAGKGIGGYCGRDGEVGKVEQAMEVFNQALRVAEGIERVGMSGHGH